MQKLNEKKILGTVPKKLQLVETFWDCPEFSRNKQNQKGITLIALIITIIVMLILVGVTINVALNGGLFNKAEEATTKTKIAQIQEALTIKKAEVLAEHNGKTPADYGITINSLDISAELKTEYGSKLIIGKDGKLYYDASVVTNATEQNEFKELGIGELLGLNYTLDTDCVKITKEEFNKLLNGETTEKIENEYFCNWGDGAYLIDFDTSSQDLLVSRYYGLNGNSGKYIMDIVVPNENEIWLQIFDATTFKGPFSTQEEINAFKIDTESVTLTLVKKDRLEPSLTN